MSGRRVDVRMRQVLEDWRYIAMVIDRLQLYIFLAVTVLGSASILINDHQHCCNHNNNDNNNKINGSQLHERDGFSVSLPPLVLSICYCIYFKANKYHDDV